MKLSVFLYCFYVQAGQQKSCSILLQWDRDICNHFWYYCKIAGTYYEFLVSTQLYTQSWVYNLLVLHSVL